MYAINASHISKGYGSPGERIEVLRDVKLCVEQGEMVAVMGPSGSGKTTLLHVLTGIDTPDRGEVRIGKEDLARMTREEAALFRRRHMGMIFQDFQLLESLTVKENILLPLILDKREERQQREALDRVLKALDMTGLADRSVTEISGGQKQRTAIGRALIAGPEIIFGDEPTGNLDLKTTGDVMRCMVRMNRQFKASFLLVTHDAYAASFCDRVLLLKDGGLVSQVKKQGKNRDFKEDIMRMLCLLGGDPDEIL